MVSILDKLRKCPDEEEHPLWFVIFDAVAAIALAGLGGLAAWYTADTAKAERDIKRAELEIYRAAAARAEADGDDCDSDAETCDDDAKMPETIDADTDGDGDCVEEES